MDATLNKDGTVRVQETHTYSFDGDFNGITREIIPKKGAAISSFSATENQKELTVEKEKNLYRIYRSGSDETIVVSLQYTIENGVEVYSDIAEFYWPFFDERNESTYENLTITIHPPEQTTDVIAFGYDEAFHTESVQSDGSVIFHLGEVPAEENGDIRVAYDRTMFTSSSIIDKSMKNSILLAKQNLEEEEQKKEEKHQFYKKIALIGIPSFSILLGGLMLVIFVRERNKKEAIKRRIPSYFFIPTRKMSLPAIIRYTNRNYLFPEAMGAAFLDLIRQGIIKKEVEDTFSLIQQPKTLKKHEQILIEFLFFVIGQRRTFHFDDLNAYIEKKKNHEKYHTFQVKWQNAVKLEQAEHPLYEEFGPIRWIFVLITIMLLPFFILFPMNDVFLGFFLTIVLWILTLCLAIFYRPKSWEGLELLYEWQALRSNFQQISKEDWEKLTEDEQSTLYIYGLGIKDKNMTKKNKAFAENFTIPKININTTTSTDSTFDFLTLYYVGAFAPLHFNDANKSVERTIHANNGGSSSSSGGGGVGGGGGGSGAF